MFFGEKGVFGKLGQLVCMLTIGGPVLIIIGIVYFKSSLNDTRGASILKYNTAVTSWQTPDYFATGTSNATFFAHDANNATSAAYIL